MSGSVRRLTRTRHGLLPVVREHVVPFPGKVKIDRRTLIGLDQLANWIPRRQIQNHLMNGLSTLGTPRRIEGFAVDNCPDDTDFASQLTQLGVNMAVQRRKIARLHELENALKRLGETDYGVCEECGEGIGVARLKANPSARLCVLCQSTLEDNLTR